MAARRGRPARPPSVLPRQRREVVPRRARAGDGGERRDVGRIPRGAAVPDGQVGLRAGQRRPQRVVEGMGHPPSNPNRPPRLPASAHELPSPRSAAGTPTRRRPRRTPARTPRSPTAARARPPQARRSARRRRGCRRSRRPAATPTTSSRAVAPGRPRRSPSRRARCSTRR